MHTWKIVKLIITKLKKKFKKTQPQKPDGTQTEVQLKTRNPYNQQTKQKYLITTNAHKSNKLLIFLNHYTVRLHTLNKHKYYISSVSYEKC